MTAVAVTAAPYAVALPMRATNDSDRDEAIEHNGNLARAWNLARATCPGLVLSQTVEQLMLTPANATTDSGYAQNVGSRCEAFIATFAEAAGQQKFQTALLTYISEQCGIPPMQAVNFIFPMQKHPT